MNKIFFKGILSAIALLSTSCTSNPVSLRVTELPLKILEISPTNITSIIDRDRVVEPKKIATSDTLTLNLLHTLSGHQSKINQVAFSTDSQTISSVSEDGAIVVWNIRGKLLHTLEGNGEFKQYVFFSPDGLAAAAFSSANSEYANASSTFTLANLKSSSIYFLEHEGAVTTLEYSPDNEILATAGNDLTVKLWNKNGELVHILESHNSPIYDLIFSPDSQFLAFVTSTEMLSDYSIKLWNRNGKLVNTLRPAHRDIINSVTFSPDGSIFASASNDYRVKIWSKNGELLHTLEGTQDSPDDMIAGKNFNGISRVVFSPDSKYLAFGNNNVINVFDLQGKLLFTLKDRSYSYLVFSPDSQTITLVNEKNIEQWNLKGELIYSFDAGISNLKFSPDGKLVTAFRDNRVQLWTVNGELVHTFKRGTSDLVFSPNGNLIASIAGDRTIELWSLN